MGTFNVNKGVRQSLYCNIYYNIYYSEDSLPHPFVDIAYASNVSQACINWVRELVIYQ